MMMMIIDDDIYVDNVLGFRPVLQTNKRKMPPPSLCIFNSPQQSQKVRWFWCKVFTFAVPCPVMLWHLWIKPESSVSINDKVHAGRPRNRNLIRCREKRPDWLWDHSAYQIMPMGTASAHFHPLPIHAAVLQIPNMPYGVAKLRDVTFVIWILRTNIYIYIYIYIYICS
jgi:hypothetical protein